MKHLSYWLFGALLALSCKKSASNPSTPTADQSSFATAATVNQRLGRGINLGDTYESWPMWRAADPADFGRMASIGLKHVRLPIRWEAPGRTSYQSPYTINPAFLDTIRGAVDAARKAGLLVIINMHHHDSLFANPAAMKPMFLAQWKQIAEYFKGYSDSLVFEVMNEPNGGLTPALWNTYFSDALSVIRASNPKRTVLMGVANWGGLGALGDLQIPNDDHLILTIHYYNPFHFTHQGASWVDGSNAWLGTVWNDTQYDREAIESEFQPALKLSKDKNIPIHIGEFGSYSTADMASRIRWTRFLSRWFDQQGFSYALWEFNSGFGIYDPSTGQYRQGLLNAYTTDAMTAPTPTTLTTLYQSDFGAGADGWQLYNNDASAASTAAVSGGAITVTPTSAGSQDWYIQLIHGGAGIESGKTYRFVFQAHSTDNRSLSAVVQQAQSPWQAYANASFSITATDASYSFVFSAPSTDGNANLVFNLGADGVAPVTLHDIEFQRVDL